MELERWGQAKAGPTRASWRILRSPSAHHQRKSPPRRPQLPATASQAAGRDLAFPLPPALLPPASSLLPPCSALGLTRYVDSPPGHARACSRRRRAEANVGSS